MNDKIKQILSRIKSQLDAKYGKRIKQVILYGSHVRGEAGLNSDIDVLVVTDDSLNPFEVRNNLSDLLFDFVLDEGELVSVIAVPEGLYNDYNSPFILNVKAEGVVA